jgi:sortase A
MDYRGRRRGPLVRLQHFFVPDASARRAPIRTSKHRMKNALVGEPGPAFRVDPDGRGLAARLERAGSFDAPTPAADTTEEQADRLMQAVALTFLTLGLCLIAFVAYAFLFTGLQEQRQQHALLNAFVTPDKTSLFSGKIPPEGQPAAVLSIPDIGLHQVVVEGTSAADLAKGPGVMIGTARPGTKGNAVIAGRLTTGGAPFAHITRLRSGDHITVVTGLGVFHYSVTQVGAVLVGHVDPISPSRVARLTLVTSNSPLLPDGRNYVIAKLTSTPAVAPVPHSFAPASQRALSGDSRAIVPTVLWGVLFAAALVAAFVAYRRAPRYIWTVYILSTPVILALALEWFTNVYQLLPATL